MMITYEILEIIVNFFDLQNINNQFHIYNIKFIVYNASNIETLLIKGI